MGKSEEEEQFAFWERIKIEASEMRVEDPTAMADWYLNYHNHDRPALKSVKAEYRQFELLKKLYGKGDEVYALGAEITRIHQDIKRNTELLVREGLRRRNETDLSWAKELPPAQKIALLEAMGFKAHRAPHQMSCASLQGSGIICTCVWPATEWSAPQDVLAHLGETYEERQKATEERNAKWDKDPEDEENEFDPER